MIVSYVPFSPIPKIVLDNLKNLSYCVSLEILFNFNLSKLFLKSHRNVRLVLIFCKNYGLSPPKTRTNYIKKDIPQKNFRQF